MIGFRRGWQVAGMGCLALLAGCIDRPEEDLENFLAGLDALKPARVEPLPDIQIYMGSPPKVKIERDPFVLERLDRKRSSGLHPDQGRVREPLEKYSINSLVMVGTIKNVNGPLYGLVKAPDGIVYRVGKGNYMGTNHGRITEVKNNEMVLREIVPDGTGGWRYNIRLVPLTEQG